MITLTQSGAGYYVEGDRYKAYVEKGGIRELYLKGTGNPSANVLYGDGITFHEAWGGTSGTVRLTNGDSTLGVVEENTVRAVLSVAGYYEPGTGGTQYGTGEARLVFYPDRFSIDSASIFTTSLGSGMRMRPVTGLFGIATSKSYYAYDEDGAGGFAEIQPGGSWSARRSNIAGPLTMQTIHPVGSLPAGHVTVVVQGGEGLSSFDLWDVLSGGVYLGWRVQKSTAVAGQRYRAVSVFDFSVSSAIPIGTDEDEAKAVRDDFSRPDPLDGSANAGAVLTGWEITGESGDENADGYSERETAYVLTASSSAGYLDVRFDDRRGTSLAADFRRPVIKLVGWGPVSKPDVYRWSGTAWQQLVEGTDYATTTETDESGTGLNRRVVQMLSDYSGQGAGGARFKFVEVYEEPPGESDWVLKVGGAAVDFAAEGVSLRRLANSWRRGRRFEFAQSVKHTQGSYDVGVDVEVECRGTRVFLGDITERALVGLPGAEEVVYGCRDLRARSEKVNIADPALLAPRLVFNACEGDEDYDEARSGLTVAGILQWLFAAYEEELAAAGVVEAGVPGFDGGDLADLDATPPKLVLYQVNFDEALRTILAFEPEVIFGVDPASRKYRFRRLGDLEARDVTYNGDEKVMSALVRPSVDGRYTAYRIVGQGEHVTRSAYLSEGELEEYWGGRATTTADVEAGSGVVIPVDKTESFKAGDTVTVGEGAQGETTTLQEAPSGSTLKANLSKSHLAGTFITNKVYLENHWTIVKAYGSDDTDAGTATGGTSNTLVDASQSWAADRWTGGEVTLDKGWIIQKRTVTDSDATRLYLSSDWIVDPEVGDGYEIEKGESRYRHVFSRYRISDETKRRIAATIPEPDELAPPIGPTTRTSKPRVLRETSDGPWLMTPVVFDYTSGIFTTTTPIAEGNLRVEGEATAAGDVRLDYAYIGNPCEARYPAVGFAGDAYSEGGIERERVVYEGSFMTPASTAQYEALAEKLLWPLKDIAYKGEVGLGELEAGRLELDYRLNIKAQDDLGGEVATGLEGLGALVSRAEIDFSRGITRLVLADAESLRAQGEWLKALSDTLVLYQEVEEASGGGGGSGGGGSGGGGSGGGGGNTVTVNEVAELLGGIFVMLGGGLVTSVSAGGANGIIHVEPNVGDVMVSHADYVAGNKTPCNYAPRWQ